MGRTYPSIDSRLRAFVEAQRIFFVATAPSGADGHVNLSPKGLDSFRILDEQTVAYMDLVGSGVETIAHLRDNGRICVTRISDSCGYGVPLYHHAGDRPQLTAWAERKGPSALHQYQRDKNARSIDGCPGLQWTGHEPDVRSTESGA